MAKNNIQSVLISRKYSFKKALDFIKSKRFKHYKVDITDRFFRFRQHEPKLNKRYTTVKSSTAGIEYIIEY